MIVSRLALRGSGSSYRRENPLDTDDTIEYNITFDDQGLGHAFTMVGELRLRTSNARNISVHALRDNGVDMELLEIYNEVSVSASCLYPGVVQIFKVVT